MESNEELIVPIDVALNLPENPEPFMVYESFGCITELKIKE